MESVRANLSIELVIECPHCEECIDLMGDDITDLDDGGYISRQAFPDGHWSDGHDKFDEKVECPFCEKEIHVQRINW